MRAVGTADASSATVIVDRLAVDAAGEVHLVDRELDRHGERRGDRRDGSGDRRELAEREGAVDRGPAGGGRGRRARAGRRRAAAAVARGRGRRRATVREGRQGPGVPHVPGGAVGAMTRGYRRAAREHRFQIRAPFAPTTPRSVESARDGGMITNRHLRAPAAAAALALVLAAAPGPAGAWPGDPDGAFGSCGVRRIDVVPGAPSALRAASGAADGKVLAAGSADGDGLVLRLAAGAPDATFGAAGWTRVVLRHGATRGSTRSTRPPAAVRSRPGAGSPGASSDSIVVALKANGKLDTAFQRHRQGHVRRGRRRRRDRGRGRRRRQRVRRRQRRTRVATSRTTPPRAIPDPGWDGDGRRSGLAMTVASIALRPDGSVYVGGATTGGAVGRAGPAARRATAAPTAGSAAAAA